MRIVTRDNSGMDEEMDEVARGIGRVCISASSREWSLAYCTSVLRRAGDEWFINVWAGPGQPLKEFRKLVRAVAIRFPELRADVDMMLANAERFLALRHRAVHSVVASELDPDSQLYDAWHAKTDLVWSIVPGDLDNLAGELERCAREVDAFGAAWEERANSDS